MATVSEEQIEKQRTLRCLGLWVWGSWNFRVRDRWGTVQTSTLLASSYVSLCI